MKNKLIVGLKCLSAVILLAAIVSLFFNHSPVKLSSPTNLEITDTTLTWNSVRNATNYMVEINEIEYYTSQSSYSLVDLDQDITYVIRVKAIGDDINYSTSDWSQERIYTP